MYRKRPYPFYIDTPSAALTFGVNGNSTVPYRNAGSPTLTFDRECTAYKDTVSAGVRSFTSVLADVVRISSRADTGGTTRIGFQLEPERTNLCLSSNDFRTGVEGNPVANKWFDATGVTLVTTSTMTGPIGANTMQAFKIDTTGTNQAAQYSANITYSVGAKYTQSIFLSKGSDGVDTTALFRVYDGVTAHTLTLTFATGAVVVTGAGATAGVENWGNGIFRVWITKTYAAGGDTYVLVFGPETAHEAGQVGFYASQVQVEVGAYPSSPMVTTDAAVTRLADDAYYTGLANIGGVGSNQQGALEVGYLFPVIAMGATNLLALSDGGAAEDRLLLSITADDYAKFESAASGEAGGNVTDNSDIVNGVHQVLQARWMNDRLELDLNGANQGNTTTCENMPDELDAINLFTSAGLMTGLKILPKWGTL